MTVHHIADVPVRNTPRDGRTAAIVTLSDLCRHHKASDPIGDAEIAP